MGAGRQWQKRIVHATAYLCLAFACLVAPPAGAGGDLTGEPAPDFTLKSMDGKNLRLSEYRGGVVLLSLWASWCGDCREQLNDLNALHSELRERGVAVITVSVDSRTERAIELATDLQLQIPVLLDARQTVARQYDPRFMPMTVLIDPAGTIRHVHEGFELPDTAVYLAEVEQLLADFGPIAEEG
jgi:peroxiredoxin